MRISDTHNRGHGLDAGASKHKHSSVLSQGGPLFKKVAAFVRYIMPSLLEFTIAKPPERWGRSQRICKLADTEGSHDKNKNLEEESEASNSVSPLALQARRRVQNLTQRRRSARQSPGPVDEPRTPLDHYLQCRNFEYIVGTSIGGLVNIILCRLSMTVDECFGAYETLSDRVFGSPRWFQIHTTPYLIPCDKYDPENFRNEVCVIVK